MSALVGCRVQGSNMRPACPLESVCIEPVLWGIGCCSRPMTYCRPGPPSLVLTRVLGVAYLDVTPPTNTGGVGTLGVLTFTKPQSVQPAGYASADCENSALCKPCAAPQTPTLFHHAAVASKLNYTLTGFPDGGSTPQRPNIVLTGQGSAITGHPGKVGSQSRLYPGC